MLHGVSRRSPLAQRFDNSYRSTPLAPRCPRHAAADDPKSPRRRGVTWDLMGPIGHIGRVGCICLKEDSQMPHLSLAHLCGLLASAMCVIFLHASAMSDEAASSAKAA